MPNDARPERDPVRAEEQGGFYSSDAFLSAAARAFFPGKAWRVRVVEVDGCAFRTAEVGRRRRLLHECPFQDYLLPLPRGVRAARRARFLRRTLHDEVPAEAFSEPPPGLVAAPLIRWAAFSDFDAFRAFVGQRSKSCFSKADRMGRKLGREVGELRFTEHTDDPAVLQQLFAWKSAQFSRTNLPDVLALPGTRELFENLLADGALQQSTLHAGDRLAAVHVGPRYGGRFYHWVPAYEPDLHKYAPGTTLNHQLMQWSLEAGDDSFDLLLGDEDYKFRYATHVALVGPRGTPPVRDRAERVARAAGREVVRRAPWAEAGLRELMRRLRERGIAR